MGYLADNSKTLQYLQERETIMPPGLESAIHFTETELIRTLKVIIGQAQEYLKNVESDNVYTAIISMANAAGSSGPLQSQISRLTVLAGQLEGYTSATLNLDAEFKRAQNA